MKKPVIGFVGQGWIGKHYADDFERRGFTTVRYGLQKEYRGNKDRIRECDIVIIAVPTPTTSRGFDLSIVESALPLVGKGKIAVIKSTIMPGSAKRLQKKHPNTLVFYSPEFLSVSTAAYDAGNPFSNIVGLPANTARHRKAAKEVHAVLPKAPFSLTCDSTEAEIVKYSHNMSGYTQIITFNILYDLAKKLGCNWETIQTALAADPYVPSRYAKPVHKKGRGAGGGCFIKDFAAFRMLYAKQLPRDRAGIKALQAFEAKNLQLLVSTKKDLDLLRGVYGDTVQKRAKKAR